MLDIFLEYLVTYLPVLLSLIAFIIGLISVIVRNKGQYTVIKEFIASNLPIIINDIEAVVVGADKKKQIALTTIMTAVSFKFGSLKKSDYTNLADYASDMIESVLSTPQKKEK